MKYADVPVVPTTAIFREARVSATRGQSVIQELVEAGKISVLSTPTKREFVTPPHGQVLYDALTGSP